MRLVFFGKISGFLSLPKSGMTMSYVEKLHIGLRGVNRNFGLRVLNWDERGFDEILKNLNWNEFVGEDGKMKTKNDKIKIRNKQKMVVVRRPSFSSRNVSLWNLWNGKVQ